MPCFAACTAQAYLGPRELLSRIFVGYFYDWLEGDGEVRPRNARTGYDKPCRKMNTRSFERFHPRRGRGTW